MEPMLGIRMYALSACTCEVSSVWPALAVPVMSGTPSKQPPPVSNEALINARRLVCTKAVAGGRAVDMRRFREGSS